MSQASRQRKTTPINESNEHETILPLLTALLLAPLVALHAADAEPPTGKRTVSVTVDLGKSVHTMRGGIGVSWHAIGPTVFHYPNLNRDNRCCRGSAFGGKPPTQSDRPLNQAKS